MNEEQKRLRDEKRAALKEIVHVADNTMLEVVTEASDHLLENFDVGKNPFFQNDFVVLMGAGFCGHHKQMRKPIASSEIIVMGDLHMFSHVLAEYMSRQPQFASAIFHAIEVYSKQKACGDGEQSFGLGGSWI